MVNDLINEYLADDSKREMVAKRGRDKVMREHTWEVRMKSLLEQIVPILDKLQESTKS